MLWNVFYIIVESLPHRVKISSLSKENFVT